jgi:hypothetical protein
MDELRNRELIFLIITQMLRNGISCPICPIKDAVCAEVARVAITQLIPE